MEVYEGYIAEDFLKAEVEFVVSLPEYCEDQKFTLSEEVEGEEEQILTFSLLLNERSAIVTTIDGIAIYTGEILATEVETVVICQLIIDKEQVESFPSRKFKLQVL